MSKNKNARERRNIYKNIIKNFKSSKGGALIPTGGALIPFSKKKEYEESNAEWEELDAKEVTEPKERRVRPMQKSKKEKNERQHQGSGFELIPSVSVIVITLSISVGLIMSAFAVATSMTAGEDAPTESTPTPSDKIVFVRDDTTNSGILAPAELYEKCHSSVISFEYKGSEGYTHVGAGFVFDQSHVALCAMGLSDGQEINIHTYGGESLYATVLGSDGISGLALAYIEGAVLSPVSFAKTEELLIGERLYAIGTPDDHLISGNLLPLTVTDNDKNIAVYSSGVLEKKGELLSVDRDIGGGLTGSPVFDEYGSLAGIDATFGENPTGGLVIPAHGIYDLLCAIRDGKALKPDLYCGVITPAARLGLIGETVLVGDIYGFKLSGFTPCGSDVERSLKKGDVIIEIGGNAVCRENDIAKALEAFAPYDTVSIRLLRGEQVLTYSIMLGK